MRTVWWKGGVVYQLYPRSFKDGNGDGVGDLAGILEKVDYLVSLGITIVWLNPIYKSPMKDAGYDISDYRDIDPIFGTLSQFDQLVKELHDRGIKVVMDLVANHCSDQHAWFQSALKDHHSPYRDFFFWKKGSGDAPPNNWRSFFGGPAWEKVGDEWYLHLFAKEQPDLNWENPDLRREFYTMMRFWMDRGIDGFRLDAVTFISKDPSFRDLRDGEPLVSIDGPYTNGPRIVEYFREMHREVFCRYSSIIMAECPGVFQENALDYLGGDEPLVDMLFLGEIIDLDRSPRDKFVRRVPQLSELKKTIAQWQSLLHKKGGNCFFWMNHDQPRSVSRFGDEGRYRVESAKTLMMALFCFEGTPFLYQGDELGMTNARFGSIDDFRDVDSLNYWSIQRQAGVPEAEILARIQDMGRDHSRTPMPWSEGNHGGFTTGTPWIGLNPNYKTVNVAAEEAQNDSILAFTRTMIAFRKTSEVLQSGEFRLLDADNERTFTFQRIHGQGTLRVVLNFSDKTEPLLLPVGAQLILTTGTSIPDVLAPWEGRIYQE